MMVGPDARSRGCRLTGYSALADACDAETAMDAPLFIRRDGSIYDVLDQKRTWHLRDGHRIFQHTFDCSATFETVRMGGESRFGK